MKDSVYEVKFDKKKESSDEMRLNRILETLNEPIINELFMEIVMIIEFFCKELSRLVLRKKLDHGIFKLPTDRKLYDLYDLVCIKMDEAEREKGLFNCLKIPNDDVKLKVVNALQHVPIYQISRVELYEMLKLMRGK